MSKPRSVVVALAGALLAPGAASAFEWSGAKWAISPGEQVPYVVSETLGEDVTDADSLEAIQMAHQVWNNVTCSYMSWVYEGRTANTAWGEGDGENVVSWREENWGDSSSALGIASMLWDFSGFSDTDIKFNGEHHSWRHFAPDQTSGEAVDVAAVGTHEVGHCLGLGHSAIAGSTMWPSTGPGDLTPRSLGADDIEGVCNIYPSGGPVPDPVEDPIPPTGTVDFGGDCRAEPCLEGLFCVHDGRNSFCSRPCTSDGEPCGDGYYCALHAGGGGVCAQGEDPHPNLAGFGQECGGTVGCASGLACVEDDAALYCTGPCLGGICPEGYFCTELPGGSSLCAREEGTHGGELPQLGEPCTAAGLCERGFFCMNDPVNVNEETGKPIPYCTTPCPEGTCEDGYECMPVAPSGTACRKIPTAGERVVGQVCWVNPLAPWQRPSCGEGLICVDYVMGQEEVLEPGFCTKNCRPDDCCPEGFGCAALTPVVGQCRPERADDPEMACATAVGPDADVVETVDSGVVDSGAPAEPEADGGSSGGCQQGGGAAAPWWLVALGLVSLRRRRRA